MVIVGFLVSLNGKTAMGAFKYASWQGLFGKVVTVPIS